VRPAGEAVFAAKNRQPRRAATRNFSPPETNEFTASGSGTGRRANDFTAPKSDAGEKARIEWAHSPPAVFSCSWNRAPYPNQTTL